MVLSDSAQNFSSVFKSDVTRLSFLTEINSAFSDDDLKDIIANEMPLENPLDIDYFADINQDVYIT